MLNLPDEGFPYLSHVRIFFLLLGMYFIFPILLGNFLLLTNQLIVCFLISETPFFSICKLKMMVSALSPQRERCKSQKVIYLKVVLSRQVVII